MTENNVDKPNEIREKAVKWGIFAIALIIAFLVGFIPMWMKAGDCAAEHEVTKKSLARSEISNLVAASVIDARRGEYEAARQQTSEFFTRLDSEINKGENSVYSTAQNEKLKNVFSNRDAIITLLARRDPASVERLSDIFLVYREAIGTASATQREQIPTSTGSAANTP